LTAGFSRIGNGSAEFFSEKGGVQVASTAFAANTFGFRPIVRIERAIVDWLDNLREGLKWNVWAFAGSDHGNQNSHIGELSLILVPLRLSKQP
jgi:hypothetical protein